MPWALQARDLLAEQWGVGAEVWSVTSWGELRRDGVECERHNLRAPGRRAAGALRHGRPSARPTAPVVAVSDWMRALPDLIRQWVPAPFTSLGTDGFGLSDTRPAVRRHFNVDAESITVAALASAGRAGRDRPRRGGRGRGEVPDRRPAGGRTADLATAAWPDRIEPRSG